MAAGAACPAPYLGGGDGGTLPCLTVLHPLPGEDQQEAALISAGPAGPRTGTAWVCMVGAGSSPWSLQPGEQEAAVQSCIPAPELGLCPYPEPREHRVFLVLCREPAGTAERASEGHLLPAWHSRNERTRKLWRLLREALLRPAAGHGAPGAVGELLNGSGCSAGLGRACPRAVLEQPRHRPAPLSQGSPRSSPRPGCHRRPRYWERRGRFR